MEEKLKRWQVLYIDDIKYIVENMIEYVQYTETTCVWQEYEIVNDLNERKWLCIEKDDLNNIQYSLYTKYYGNINENEPFFTVDSYEYELYEKSEAVVMNYFGNVDVSIKDKFKYSDYMTRDKKRIISIEAWGDILIESIEKSQGEYIDNSRIKIINDTNIKVPQQNIKEKFTPIKIIYTIIAIIAILIIIVITFLPMILGLFTNKSIDKYLEDQQKYTYITSITNNINNKKAKVYKSTFSTMDETVKDIIDGVPEGITDVTDTDPDTDEDGIGLHTSKEFAYVYLENKDVYVQVSSKKYMNNSSSIYHTHFGNYYRSAFNSTEKSNIYSSYSNSARQQSINSRAAVGGGISVGK